MAKVLIKLKFEGLSDEKQGFDAIYGDYTIDSVGYVIGSYGIPFDNIASIFTGVVESFTNRTLII